MNNQAAQTMPELPARVDLYSTTTGRGWGYTADQMRDYGEACAAQLRVELDRIEEQGAPWVPEMLEWLEKHDCCPELPFTDYELIEALEARFGEAALSQTAGVVEGWKLVPVEPTEAMCEAAMSSLGWSRSQAAATAAPITPASPMMEGAMKVWSGMLAAAPAASGVHPDALPDGTLSKSTAKRVEALAASGGGGTNPAPGHDVDEYLSDYVRIAHLIGSIFFYGNFKAETFNERELESLLRKVGRFYESEEQVISGEPAVERPLHFATENLIRRFSDALREKLSAAEKKYGYSDGWASPDWMDECRKHLMQHIAKGDPRDVAAYCAFLWHHGESTTPQPPSAASVSERARELLAQQYMGSKFAHLNAIGLCIRDGSIADDTAISFALRAIEQALTQQRGEAAASGEWVDRDAWAEALELPQGYTVEEFLPGGWHYAWTRADGERMVSGTTWNHPALAAIAAWQYAPATTPHPSADAVRELVRRAYEVVHHDDECPAIGGCGDKDCRCDAVPFLRELESLLSGGSHA